MALNNVGLGFQVSAKDNASPALEQVSNKLSKTSDAAKKAKVSFEDIGGEAKDVGAKLGLAGAAGLAGMGLAANEAAKFEFGVAQVATEADKAQLPMSAINDIAKKMALTYGGDLNTQVAALYQGVAAGAGDAAKAMALLDGANRLAIAGNTDQATAILGITKVLNNYGLEFSRSTDVADAFFVAVKNGQTTVGELGDAVGQVAALGKGAGLSMEELIGALGTAATLGKDTAGSAASLKAALSGVAHPTADAAKEAKRLGIEFDSTALRSKGLVGFLKSITSSANYNADTFSKLFGSMEASGFMAALVSNDYQALNGMMDGMAKKGGGAQEAFETMSATMQQQGAILKANVQVAMVELGNAVLPLIKGFTTLGLRLVQMFTALPAGAKQAIAAIIVLTSVLLIAIGGLLGIVSAVAAVAAAGEALLIVVAATVGLFAQFVAMAALAAGAVYLLKRAYDQNLGGLADTVDRVVSRVKLGWDALSQLFSTGSFSGSVLTEMKKAENAGIKDFAIQAFLWFNRIKNFFDGLVTGVTMAFNRLAPVFARIGAAITAIGDALGFAKDGPLEAAQAFSTAGKAGERMGDLIGVAAEWIAGAIASVLEAVNWTVRGFKIMRTGALPLTTALASLWDSFMRLAEAVTGTGASGSTSFSSFGATVGAVAAVVVSAITSIVNVLSIVVATVAAFIAGVIQTFQGLGNFFAGFMVFLNGLLTFNFGQILEGLKLMAFGILQTIMGVVNAVAGPILAIIEKVLAAFGLVSASGGAAAALKGETGSLLNSVQQGLGLNYAAGGQDRRALAGVGNAAPAVGATGAAAQANAANAAAGGAVNATIPVAVVLDGEKVGEATAKYNSAQAQREGAPMPALAT